MKEKVKNIVLVILALYVFVDIGFQVLDYYGMTTRDETCRNESQARYYKKYGSLKGYAKRAAQSRYVEEHGTLKGFSF